MLDPYLNTPTQRRNRTTVLVGLVVLLLFSTSLAVFFGIKSTKEATLLTADPDLSETNLTPIGITNDQKLTVNAALQLNGGLSLAPVALPTTASPGTLVFESTTNTLQYYNGNSFVAIETSPPLAGSPGRVTSFQGLQGNVSLTAGQGITISGTTISATPQTVPTVPTGIITNLLGSNGITITRTPNSDTATISLPTAASPGLCLVSTITAPIFTACTSGGVSSLNSQFGAINIANATGASNTITLDNASTTTKGIAQFNNINFTDSLGTINTIQDIATTSSPTFNGLTVTSLTTNGDTITDFTGTGLSVSGGSLQTTLGLDIDLASSEVTGTLGIGNGGTGQTTTQAAINALSQLTTNGDLLYYNGTNSTRLTRGANNDCLLSNTTTILWGSCPGDGVGVTTIGALDGGTANATGATITGSTLFLQSASATNPGLINTTTQTFAGNKTFGGLITGQSGLTVTGTTQINTTGTSTTDIGNASGGAIVLQSGSTIGLVGTTSVSGLTTGSAIALTVTNNTSTGSILVLRDFATAVLTVADGGATTFRNQTDSATAFQIQNAASTALFTADTLNSRVTVRGGSTDGAILGAELVSTTFSTGWTTTGWTQFGSQASHNVGNTNVLSTTSLTIVPGVTYLVSYYLYSHFAGDISVALGGVNFEFHTGSSTQSAFNVSRLITATNTNGLTFTPTTTASGTVSSVSVKQITPSNPTFALLNNAGSTTLEVRTGGSTLVTNTFVGGLAGRNAAGSNNTALGYAALQSSILGYSNTAIGGFALNLNTSGSDNAAVGLGALQFNTVGQGNVAVGSSALQNNRSGFNNTALGSNALNQNTTGGNNVALGQYAGFRNTTGVNNTYLGASAGNSDSEAYIQLQGLSNTTTVGAGSVALQSNSIILGNSSISAPQNIGIGTPAPTNRLSVSPSYYLGGGGNPDDGCLGGYAAQSGNTVTFDTSWCGGPFTTASIGSEIIWSNGSKATIVGFNNSATVFVTPSQTVPNDVFKIFYPGLQITGNGTSGVGTTSPSAQLEIAVQGSTTTQGLVVNNRTSTGNILNLQDASGTVALVANDGAASFLNSVNSTTAFNVRGVGGTTQRPAQAINGASTGNPVGELNAGYSFTPNTNGTITQLGARNVSGTYRVTLYQNGAILVTTLITTTGTGTWVYANIPPLNIISGTQYVVSLYSAAGNYTASTGFTGNTLTGNITVNQSLYTNGTYAVPVLNGGGSMYGQPDITFIPAQTLLNVDTTNGKTVFGRDADGTILDFRSGATVQGTISVSGTTVSYNAFTGSHYGLFDGTTASRGHLVDLTGNNQYNQGSSEPYYGITKTSTANSPNVLGAYLSTQDPNNPSGLDNPELIMAAGNGDVWIADNGSGNIMIGDPLISSGDVPGHAMRDTKQYPTSHIFAKSTTAVNWDTIITQVNGIKVTKISVLFSYYNQDNNTIDIQGGSLNITGNSILTGSLDVMGDLNVLGGATLGELTVIGSLKVGGELVVLGNTIIQNITIAGIITTAGQAPLVSTGVEAGDATVTIVGNSTSGTVTIVTGNNASAGELAKITFAEPFSSKPRVVLTPANRVSARINAYYNAETANANWVSIYADKDPQPNTVYTFTYFVVE
jgi:hypothetical protein